MERCCHSFNNNHLVTVREWWSWLREQNNVGCWEETGNDKSDSLLTSPSFTGLRILRTLWLLKNVTQLPPLLTTIRSHNSNGFADFVTWTQMSYFEASRKEDSLVGVSDIQFVFTYRCIFYCQFVPRGWHVSVNRCCVRWTLLGSKVRSSQQALSGFMVCSSRWVRHIRTSAASHRHPVNIGTL